MSTPEEINPKTEKTDQTLMRPGQDPDRRIDEEPPPATDDRTVVGAELEDAESEDETQRADRD